MLWIWVPLGVLVSLVLLPLGLGFLLPRDYRGRVRVLLDRPVQEVWRVLLDHDRHPVSGAMSRSCTLLDGGADGGHGTRWVEELGSTRLEVRREVQEEGRRLALDVHDQVAPMSARWEFELTSTEEGTEVVATNHTVIRAGNWRGPIFRLVMRFTGGAEKVLREYLRGISGDLGVTARLVDPQGT